MFHLTLVLSGTPYQSSTQLRKAYSRTLITCQSQTEKLSRHQKQKDQLISILSDQLTAENVLHYMVGKEPDFIKTLTKEKTLIHLKQILY